MRLLRRVASIAVRFSNVSSQPGAASYRDEEQCDDHPNLSKSCNTALGFFLLLCLAIYPAQRPASCGHLPVLLATTQLTGAGWEDLPTSPCWHSSYRGGPLGRHSDISVLIGKTLGTTQRIYFIIDAYPYVGQFFYIDVAYTTCMFHHRCIST